MTTHSLPYTVTFGECDPAGIVYYPNIYGWFDRCYHDWLAGFGGHASLCRQLGAVGTGLMQAQARFRRPMRPDDRIVVTMTVADWGHKALTLHYEVTRAGEVTAIGTEVRGVFKPEGEGIAAGDMSELRALIIG